MPKPVCTFVAVEGNVWSGVEVASTIVSMSFAEMFAFFKAFMAALMARSEVNSSSAAKCRRSIPVRVFIHSSLVSTVFANSLLVTILLGRKWPTPIGTALIVGMFYLLLFLATIASNCSRCNPRGKFFIKTHFC